MENQIAIKKTAFIILSAAFSLWGLPDARAQLNLVGQEPGSKTITQESSFFNGRVNPDTFTITLYGKKRQESVRQYYFNSNLWNPDYLESPRFQPEEPKVNWTRFGIVTGVVAGSYTGLYLFNKDHWWGGTRVPFRFDEQYYAKGFDKLGHFYAAKTQALIVSRLYERSNLSRNRSALLGAGVALSVQTLIEIKDGTVSSGGFDRLDELSNIMGVGWFYARERIDFLQRFDVRWMYFPSETRQDRPNYRDGKLTDDYNGQSYWVSMQVRDLLPQKMQPYWPKFIVPAAGVSLNNWPGATGEVPHVSYHLSLDLDFKHILPQNTAFLRILSDILNGIHIPAPALELHPDPTFNLIFYGQD